ncbi:GcrA cell cycle regulator [Aquamicrobium lusatiense]|uniref:GcrA cell cycle regulator n=1 Tax=Aquamicrobium lusatiense TaxID=89772 RepID=A0A7W9S0I1_9HYPH|nr:GcrA family cell cycle regulator [Aquamicrobium lusatiense]MBB6011650.1 GcrA cell cycle regulator [Aquamicrobium lusatiense]
MNWTDERVELLKKLWAEGLSASQIAAQLGGVSRNAVIGKVHRLKLSGRGRTTAAPARQKKASSAPAASKPVRAAAPARSAAPTIGATALQVQFDAEPVARQQLRSSDNVVVPISRRLDLTQLTERTCKWPNGDPLSEDFHFCGNEAGESGPYCAYHARLAFQPASERRRAC